jgi:hypothetical protein
MTQTKGEMMNRLTAILSLSVLACATAGEARAASVTFLGLGDYSTVEIIHDGDKSTVKAGELLVKVDGTNMTGFCVDLDNSVKSSWTASISSGSWLNGAKQVAYLFDTFAGSVTTGVQAAALQVAIWEVLEDHGDGYDLSKGDFKLSGSSSVATAAMSYLSALPGNLSNYNTTSYVLKSGSSPRSQHMIVPEPATLITSMLLAPIMFLRRRRRFAI